MALRIFLPDKGCPFNCPPAIELPKRAGNWGRGLFTWKLDENTIDWPTDWPWRKHLIKMLKSYITCIQLCGRRAMPKFIHAQPIQSIDNQNNFNLARSQLSLAYANAGHTSSGISIHLKKIMVTMGYFRVVLKIQPCL